MIEQARSPKKDASSAVHFSIAADAAWAPGIETPDAWRAWAANGFRIVGSTEPALKAMPAMQRRRAGFLGRMALEVAYACLADRSNVPVIFCSRHGEVSRSVDLLRDLATGEPLSPASFGLSVHNAVAGLFSIARGDTANSVALSAGHDSVEHAVIEACGLLADGEPSVLLVVYDCPLPDVYSPYEDCDEQPFAWAWLIESSRQNDRDTISLAWETAEEKPGDESQPAGLQVLRFHMSRDPDLTRTCGNRTWRWAKHARAD